MEQLSSWAQKHLNPDEAILETYLAEMQAARELRQKWEQIMAMEVSPSAVQFPRQLGNR